MTKYPDIIKIDNEKWDAALISFDYILKTGKCPALQPNVLQKILTLFQGANLSIDWDCKDPVTQAFDAMYDKSLLFIKDSPHLVKLLAKETWDKDDRMQWEDALSQVVSHFMDQQPGFDTYRSTAEFEGQETAKKRFSKLNKLSPDIEAGTFNREFDCEAMSFIEGALIQKIENALLPAAQENQVKEHVYKTCSQYYYVSGYRTNLDENVQPSGAHAFIISAATANVIEAVQDPSKSPGVLPYVRHGQDDYDFNKFIGGETFIGQDGSVFATTNEMNDSLKEKIFEKKMALFRDNATITPAPAPATGQDYTP